MRFLLMISVLFGLGGWAKIGYGTPEKLDDALAHFEAKKYKEAISNTEKLISSLALNTRPEIALAYQIMGLSYCELGKSWKAKRQFRTLGTLIPEATIDGFAASEKCSKMFLETRKKK